MVAVYNIYCSYPKRNHHDSARWRLLPRARPRALKTLIVISSMRFVEFFLQFPAFSWILWCFSLYLVRFKAMRSSLASSNGLAPLRVSSLVFHLLCCTLLYIELFLDLGNYSFVIEFVMIEFVWFWL